jgi:hypothetical protein
LNIESDARNGTKRLLAAGKWVHRPDNTLGILIDEPILIFTSPTAEGKSKEEGK